MKTATTPPPSSSASRVRKPRRRAMPPSNRTRSRSDDPQQPPWTVEKLEALASLIAEAGSVDVSEFSTTASLAPLRPSHATGAIDHLTDASNMPTWANALNVDSAESVMAAVASEVVFVQQQLVDRKKALEVLNRAKAEREEAANVREKLLSDAKALSSRLKEEREKRHALIGAQRTDLERSLSEARTRLKKISNRSLAMTETLERTKMAELEVRRRLDRMRLKAAAMRGEMVIETVDQLQRRTKRWRGEYDHGLLKNDDATGGSEHERSNGYANGDDIRITGRGRGGYEDVLAHSDISRCEAELDENSEEIEFRLLKNRYAMVHCEAEEWKQYAEEQKEQVRLIEKTRVTLEEELARCKQAMNKSSSQKNSSKNGNSSKGANARLRTAVRASLTAASVEGGRVRKSRKSKPTRSLRADGHST